MISQFYDYHGSAMSAMAELDKLREELIKKLYDNELDGLMEDFDKYFYMLSALKQTPIEVKLLPPTK